MAKITVLKDERFRKFSEMAKKCEYGTELFGKVILYYDGSNLRGDIKIKISPGHCSEEDAILKELLGF